MQISFHGAARTVTGSKHLLHLENGLRILLDCGLFQGMGKDTDALNQHFGFDPESVDLVVLSHAHIDHSGLLPKLVKDGFKGRIYCTPPTAPLAALLLNDSAHIQQSDAEYSNRRRRANDMPLLSPLYTSADAQKAIDLFTTLPYDEWTPIAPGVELLFTDAGHIIGSACVHLRHYTQNGEMRQLSFSGDLGRYRDAILRAPAPFSQANNIIVESTYGDKLHEQVKQSVDHILGWIENICIKNKGKLILPAFSLGRTQELLYAFNQLEMENRLPALDYYLDSPLSIDITAVLKQFPQYFNHRLQAVLRTDSDPFHFTGLKYIDDVAQSKQLNYSNRPAVIISSSGMAESGRVKHHISNHIENSRNGILLTGYCEPRSLGGRLQQGAKEVSIFGVKHQVNAAVGSLQSMSAHGDYSDLLQWLGNQRPEAVEKLFLVHGDSDAQTSFAHRLKNHGFREVILPEMHQQFSL